MSRTLTVKVTCYEKYADRVVAALTDNIQSVERLAAGTAVEVKNAKS